MKLQDWHSELQVLIDEVCTQENQVLARPPPETDEGRYGAWTKIEQVYGKGALDRWKGHSKASVTAFFERDQRVMQLLSPRESEQEFAVRHVSEGSVKSCSKQARSLAKGKLRDRSTREQVRQWARAFRSKINEYVYRSGNGERPQMWPLIRKVVLYGPWTVLQSGARLVDLPGVRDSNAARSNVAASYLKNCSCIWIVAPIKRAVDDRTARDLMGESFKRRLLMDGQYGSVAFICTQTDDCEPSEIWNDHKDVARHVEGRYEQMEKLNAQMEQLRDEENTLCTKQDEFAQPVHNAEQDIERHKEVMMTLEADQSGGSRDRRSSRRKNGSGKVSEFDSDSSDGEFGAASDDFGSDSDAEQDVDGDAAVSDRESDAAVQEDDAPAERDIDAEIAAAAVRLEELQQTYDQVNANLHDWNTANFALQMKKLKKSQKKLQAKLKPLCAQVRNEYSTRRLQEDFEQGLVDLKMDEDGGAEDEQTLSHKLDVFCISANDYLKVTLAPSAVHVSVSFTHSSFSVRCTRKASTAAD
jgi:ABC-type phosphate transport system auxiliary subunit